MDQPRIFRLLCGVASLTLVWTVPTAAQTPEAVRAPWIARDIGAPQPAGSASVDTNGTWTIQGGGRIANTNDSFHYAYQPLKSNASITARFLDLEGGNSELARAGLMVREDAAAGAANLNYTVLAGHGLYATMRFEPQKATPEIFEAGRINEPEPNLWLRLQRVGNIIAAFYSDDGSLWYQAFSPQLLPSLKEEALYGLAVASHRSNSLTTATWDQVTVERERLSIYGLQSCISSQSVTLEWGKLPGALAYHIYRGPVDATRDQMVRLDETPVTGTTFTDASTGLVNGEPVLYAVAAVVPGAGGTPVEGPLVALPVTPAVVPPEMLACSIDQGAVPGSVLYHAASKTMTLSGSGNPLFTDPDNLYFLSQLVEGDVQITVKVLTPPTGIDPIAALMMRESLDPRSRHLALGFATAFGLVEHWRSTTFGPQLGDAFIPKESFEMPVTIRLTRRGSTITPEYSKDSGQTFRPLGRSVTFNPPLPELLYVGIASNSGRRWADGTAEFSDLVIQKL